jgi:hypothetical protein
VGRPRRGQASITTAVALRPVQELQLAASYSGPAAIRLLRASCGQQPHKDMYDPRPPTTCSPIWPRPASRRILMNHDGRFDNFRNYVETEIGIQGVKMESTDGVPVAMRAFDDSPILDDFNTFDHWYKQHLAQDKAPWRSTTTRSRCTTAIACPTSA